jgi:mono/diheme cytochrome c family protein
MKKVFKWIGVILVALLGIITITLLVLYQVGKKRLTTLYPALSVEAVSVPTDMEAISHGRHVAVIWSCTKCHGDDLSGRPLTKDPISATVPVYGVISASNLTRGEGGVGAYYTDQDWIRSIRFGIKPTRQGILYMNYSMMSDRDLGDLIAYLKQVPPVNKTYPPLKYGPLVPVTYALGIYTPREALKENMHPVNYPEHTFRHWKKEEFIAAFRNGNLPNGKKFGPIMSSATFREMTNDELEALWIHFTIQNQ